MNEEEEREVHKVIEEAIQEIPAPFRLFARLGHRIALRFRKRRWKKWRKSKALHQAAGMAAQRSSRQTEKQEREKREK